MKRSFLASIVIDGKYGGKRFSVSIDTILFGLFSCVVNEPRKLITQKMASGDIKCSQSARIFIYRKIVKPSVIKEYEANNNKALKT